MSTLLDKALLAPPGAQRRVTSHDEMVDLAVAYLLGSITTTQAGAALGTSRQSAWQRMMTQFCRAVRSGQIHLQLVSRHAGNGTPQPQVAR